MPPDYTLPLWSAYYISFQRDIVSFLQIWKLEVRRGQRLAYILKTTEIEGLFYKLLFLPVLSQNKGTMRKKTTFQAVIYY